MINRFAYDLGFKLADTGLMSSIKAPMQHMPESLASMSPFTQPSASFPNLNLPSMPMSRGRLPNESMATPMQDLGAARSGPSLGQSAGTALPAPTSALPSSK